MEFRYLFTLTMFIVINMTEASNFEEPNCPRCSKYEYEEKTLERLIRMQNQWEIMKEQWSSWEQSMKEKMLEFTDKMLKFNEAEVEREKMQDKQKADINTTLMNVHQQVSRMSQDLMDEQTEINKTVLKYKDELQTPTVLFKARGVTNKSPTNRQMVIFGTIVTNVGGGYASSTGYFTAPHSGTYLFTVQFCTQRSKWMYAQIIAADNVIGTTSHYEADTAATCTSGDGVAVLTQGQTAWIKCYDASSGTVIYQTDAFSWNTFSGVLIHTGTE